MCVLHTPTDLSIGDSLDAKLSWAQVRNIKVQSAALRSLLIEYLTCDQVPVRAPSKQCGTVQT